MARTTPTVRHGELVWREQNSEWTIEVGSAAWHKWLDGATRFNFAGECGTFTARKERFQRGGFYWRAYRTSGGKSYRGYLGKPASLSLEHLEEVARLLAERSRIRASSDGGTPAEKHTQDRGHQHRLAGNARVVDDASDGTSVAQATVTAEGGADQAILITKLFVPPQRAGLVSRPRLTERLNTWGSRAAVLVSAPAGYGKTTLLGEWLANSQRPAGWVSLDAGDNDPVRFWTFVIAALEAVQPGLGEYPLALLRSSRDIPIESVLTALLNALARIRTDVTLVLDDYHVITSQAIHSGLAFMLDHLPQTLHLVIASRVAPPLPLARLRAHGELGELNAGDLTFTDDEVRAFFGQVQSPHLTHGEMAALTAKTEGWIVGLQLAAMAMQTEEDAQRVLQAFKDGSHRSLADYLLQEVLGRQPAHIKSFLLSTCVLEGLCGDLCDAVVGDAAGPVSGQAMLEEIERAHLFLVPLDGERWWYRYHHLFAEFLRLRLSREQPERVADLHARAARWYAEANLPYEAVRHALEAKDYLLAVRLIEQYVEELEGRGETTTVVNWLEQLPQRTLRERPQLCIALARNLIPGGSAEAVEARVRDAEEWVATPIANGAVECMDVDDMRGQIASIRATLCMWRGDYPSAIELGRRAVELLAASKVVVRHEAMLTLGTAYAISGRILAALEIQRQALQLGREGDYPGGVLVSLYELGALSFVQTRLREAAVAFKQVVDMSMEQTGGPLPATAVAYRYLAKVRYEWNDLTAADSYLARAMELNQYQGDVGLELRCYTLLQQLRLAQGDMEGAHAAIREVERVRDRPRHRGIHMAETCIARMWLFFGNTEPAIRLVDERGLSVTDELSYRQEYEHIVLARLLLAQGHPETAVTFLERLRCAAETRGHLLSVLEVLVLQAIGLHARGETDRALDALARALALSEPGGFIRTFLDEGPAIMALLRKLAKAQSREHGASAARRVPLSYIRCLLAAGGHVDEGAASARSSQAGTANDEALDVLSDREMEIVRFIAAGRSNAEIAQALVLELSTVKWHLKNIYGKLQVGSRTQAVAQARELGVLP